MNPDQLADILRALGYGAYVPVWLAIVGLAAKVAAVAPPVTPTSTRAWRVLRAVLDLVGGNWGSARNAVFVEVPPPSAAISAALPMMLMGLGFSLSACGTSIMTARTPQQAIFLAASTYEGALALAGDYAGLPPCGAGASTVCADPAEVEKIGAIVAISTPVVTGAIAIAEAANADPVSLQHAVTAVEAAASGLSVLASTLKVK